MALNTTLNTVFKNLLVAIFAVLTVVSTSAQATPETKPAASPMPPELQRCRAGEIPEPGGGNTRRISFDCRLHQFPECIPARTRAVSQGAMGVHFLNEQLVGPVLDPMKPQILLYEPDTSGKLRLTGAEWFVPLAIAKERPKLFNQDFLGPMEGHEPVMPVELAHYDLHVWLFKNNPEGMFAPTNPAVKCTGYSYALDLDSTKMVMEGMQH